MTLRNQTLVGMSQQFLGFIICHNISLQYSTFSFRYNRVGPLLGSIIPFAFGNKGNKWLHDQLC